jgi:hypothetical protein
MEPIDPVEPVAAVREVPLADAYEVGALADTVRSLKTAVALLGLLSLLALAAAAYALTRDDEGDANGDAGSSNRVAELEKQVDDLDEDLQKVNSKASNAEDPDAADEDAVKDALSDKADAEDLNALEKTVAELQQSAGNQEQGGASEQAVTDLDARLDQAEQDIEELRTAQEEQSP